jgi:branched-subunit amino acid transport protein
MGESWLLLGVCALATYAWRGLGVFISGRIDARSEAFAWISSVAYAMIAGLIARMLVMPTGELAQLTALERTLGSAAAFVAFFGFSRRNLFAGVLAGAVAVWLLKLAA